MSRPRIGVISFPGSCDDRDALRALELVGAEGVRVWHRDADPPRIDGALVPGGFSYGDHLRPGAIARLSPAMDVVRQLAADGGPVLGICNGFQVLCEAGLLPGVLRPNHAGRFVARDVELTRRAGRLAVAARTPGRRHRCASPSSTTTARGRRPTRSATRSRLRARCCCATSTTRTARAATSPA